MTYEVLALKYRPKVFEDLVGQEAVTRTLTHAIQQNRIAHAFLFSGVRGVGKTTTARILAKALNCSSGPTVRPCGECSACTEIARGSSLDVLEIDGASNNGVAEVRDIIEASRYAPSRDRFKIYIIDEVHMLSTPAFNALLKTLEEPPPSVKFIFATTEYHKIPDTILSRCQEFEFRAVSAPEIVEQLRRIAQSEEIRVSEGALSIVARAAEGSLRDGISALDQVIAATGSEVSEKDVTEILGLIERDVLKSTAKAIVARDTEAILRIVDGLVRGGRDLRFFTSALMQYLRDVLVTRVAPHAEDLLELPGEADQLQTFARELSEEDLLRSLDVLTQAEDGLRTSPEPRFHLEMALLKLSQLRRLATFEELLARFESIEKGGAPPASGDGGGRAEKSERRPLPSPPAPAKTTEAPPSPDSPVTEAEPSDFLGRLQERFRTSKPMLHAMLSRVESAAVESDRLRLSFPPAARPLAEQLRQRVFLGLLQDQVSELLGRRVEVVVELLANGAPLQPEIVPAESSTERLASESPEAKATELRERAERDPLVRRFLETFQGEVEDVHTPPE
jgi:DNA polymerase-3 subunit gamma/tau